MTDIQSNGNSIIISFCVTVPAHFTTKNKQISVAKGKQVHVQCNVQGDTPIDIKWKIQNTQQHLDESMDARLANYFLLIPNRFFFLPLLLLCHFILRYSPFSDV